MEQLDHPSSLERQKFLEIFSSKSTVEISRILETVVLDQSLSWQWIQEQCLQFLEHNDSELRGMAVHCLGHVARLHQKLDRELVVIALRRHLHDEVISEKIQKTLSDIHLHLSVAEGFEELPIDHCLALSTFEEFLEDYPHVFSIEEREVLKEMEKKFPYTTTVKWGNEVLDEALPWCWQVFGIKDGKCDDRDCCPLILSRGEKNIGAHSHLGAWSSIWLGKTGYDFGYEKFFFKYKAARNVFEREFRKCNFF